VRQKFLISEKIEVGRKLISFLAGLVRLSDQLDKKSLRISVEK